MKAGFWQSLTQEGFKLVRRSSAQGTTADCGCKCLHSLFHQWRLARRLGYSHRRALFKTLGSSTAKYSRKVDFVRLAMWCLPTGRMPLLTQGTRSTTFCSPPCSGSIPTSGMMCFGSLWAEEACSKCPYDNQLAFVGWGPEWIRARTQTQTNVG